ncbi:MAG TPA: CDP-alcohol phosphatidyltransferase family protein [Candidatus Limnocylindria bacterium]|nr:CDP-alcohol phosphatidyltransferase family protein [Candidatus Limnocylindria bacterium]
MTAANALTLFRAAAGLPIFIALGYGERTFALVLFVVAASSDALDGYLARRGGTAEGHGIILDPLADKALVLLTLIALTLVGRAPLGIAAIIVVREVFVGAVRVFAYRSGLRTHAGTAAKAKTALEMGALALLIARPTAVAADIGAVLLTAAALIGILTLPAYLPHAKRRFT